MDPTKGRGKPSVPIPPGEYGKKHDFWDSQPVPKITEAAAEDCGPIDISKTPEDVRSTPYSLPAGFEWRSMPLNGGGPLEQQNLERIHRLLRNHYVEDEGACFRFDYTQNCLRWALCPPGYRDEWFVGVFAKSEDPAVGEKLVAFISAIPINLMVHQNLIRAAEVNFLCVHRSLRNRRLAPLLIKEVTRRVNKCDVWFALYTAGVFIPTPITDCRYFHRPINPIKLVDIGFNRVVNRDQMDKLIKEAELPPAFTVDGIRPMHKDDVSAVRRILMQGFVKDGIALYPQMDDADVEHWLLPRVDVVQTYVRVVDGAVTDVFSYSSLPSSVLQPHTPHTVLRAAYNFYCNGTTLDRRQLLQQSLIGAGMEGFDVFNALTLHDNLRHFEALGFGPGDGSLKYYLYNYRCPPLHCTQNGALML